VGRRDFAQPARQQALSVDDIVPLELIFDVAGPMARNMALDAQARQLARHGRIRTRRARVTVSGSPHRRKILAHEVNAWQDHRNKHHAKANWQFKTADARVKLKRLYPQFG